MGRRRDIHGTLASSVPAGAIPAARARAVTLPAGISLPLSALASLLVLLPIPTPAPFFRSTGTSAPAPSFP